MGTFLMSPRGDIIKEFQHTDKYPCPAPQSQQALGTPTYRRCTDKERTSEIHRQGRRWQRWPERMLAYTSPRRASRNISFENTSSSTARARISAPTMMESMRIESPRAERFDRQTKWETIFSMIVFTCSVNVAFTRDSCRMSAASAAMVHPFPGASRRAVLR